MILKLILYIVCGYLVIHQGLERADGSYHALRAERYTRLRTVIVHLWGIMASDATLDPAPVRWGTAVRRRPEILGPPWSMASRRPDPAYHRPATASRAGKKAPPSLFFLPPLSGRSLGIGRLRRGTRVLPLSPRKFSGGNGRARPV